MRIGVALLGLSIAFAGAAALFLAGPSFAEEPSYFRVPGFLFGWLALSFLWTAAGYLFLGAKVLGKRADNTRNPLMYLIAGPFIVVMQAVRRARTAISTEALYDKVARDLYVGRIAHGEELPKDTAMVVDMTAEFIEPASTVALGLYRCLPTLDGDVPDLRDLETLALEVAAFEAPVYVHCAAGHGRSALLACCALIARGDVSTPNEAMTLMKRARPKVHLSRAQRAIAERFRQAHTR